ncbi:MAG: chemotaxis protein CheW [Betaproteobacteria bacterium]|nr:chemotaxis protein CheW [Betaproteobacteria bacterium]
MSIKPEEYLQAQSFALPASGPATELSSAEQSFISKYVGGDVALALETQRHDPAAQTLPLPAEPPIAEDGGGQPPLEPSLLERLKEAPTVQMVAFYLDSQVYLIPTMAVSEVLRYVPPVLLPMAPDYVAGVINLRGKVTPLLYLEDLLTTPRTVRSENRFIIICSYKGLQVGLIFDKVHTMYTFRQEQIMWDVEARIGASAEYICGLVDVDENILGVVSVDMIIDKVLQD